MPTIRYEPVIPDGAPDPMLPCETGRYVLYADAQATEEALQRERDEWRSNAVAQEVRANDLERDCKDLLSDIDGERAKVGDLLKKIAYWEKRHRTYRELAEENMNCKQASIDAHKDAYDELESQHADHLAALRRAKAEGVREASGAAKKLANGVVPTAAMNALNLLGVELDARAAQIEEGE